MESSDAASELEILSYLNSPALRSPGNHTIPMIEQIESEEGWHFLIMLAWNMSCADRHLVWQVDDYFEKVIQSLEVNAPRLTILLASDVSSYDRVLLSCTNTAWLIGFVVSPT